MRVMRMSRRRRSPAEPALTVAEPSAPQQPHRTERPERELASRHNDGLHIVLLWDPRRDAVAISVADSRNGHEIRFPVKGSRALDAFHHPFAYAP